METADIMSLWETYNQKLDASLALNRRNTEDITRIKISSFLASMRPVKIFTILAGILWVCLVDVVLLVTWGKASIYFTASMGIQVLLTKAAIGIYIYQLALIHQTDINAPVLATQERIARLKSSTLWVTRLLILQLPLWTTFYWSNAMLQSGSITLYLVQGTITLAFLALAIWLFTHISYRNKDKKWFRVLFKGREWDPLLQAMQLLQQIGDYKQEIPVTGTAARG